MYQWEIVRIKNIPVMTALVVSFAVMNAVLCVCAAKKNQDNSVWKNRLPSIMN